MASKHTGRPSDYKPEFAQQAAKLCELGATDYELARFFEVDTSTIYRWKNTNSEFCEAVIVGKDKADDRVERALFNRAVGYTFESERVFQFQGEIVRAETEEHVPPDPGAALNWLKNRRGDKWRDKTIQEHTGKDGGPIAVEEVSGRELIERRISSLAGRNPTIN